MRTREAAEDTEAERISDRHGRQMAFAGESGKVGFDYFVYKNDAGGPYYRPSITKHNPRLGSSTS